MIMVPIDMPIVGLVVIFMLVDYHVKNPPCRNFVSTLSRSCVA